MAPAEQVQPADWAFDPSTRHVFACDPHLNRVFVFDPNTGKPIKGIDTGAAPRAMIVADRQLLVAHSGGLSIIDLDRLALSREIDDFGSPMALAYSASDKLLYLSAEVSVGRNREQLLQVRIADWFVRGRVPWWQLKTRQVRRLATSLDGKWLFAAVENRNAPGPYYLYQLANAELPTVATEPALGPQGEISAGPRSQLWFIGSALYSNDDFSRPVRKYSGDLTRVHPTADIAISTANSDSSSKYDAKLYFQRYSTGDVISSHELSLKSSTAKAQAQPFPLQRLVLDDIGSSLLVADDVGAGVLRISEQLLEGAGPALELDLPSELRGVPNKLWTVKFPVPKSDPQRRVRVQIKQAPSGLRLVDDSLVWHPTISDIGDHPIVIETRIGDRTSETRLTASIQIPHTSLGISAQRLVLDEKGEFAAVFGQLTQNQSGRAIRQSNSPPSHVAIIRLMDLAVLRREAVTGDVRDPILDSDSLHWLAKNVNVLHRLEVKGSRPIEDLTLHASVAQMFSLGDGKLVLALADSDQLNFRVLDRRSLKPIADGLFSKVSLSPWSRSADELVVYPIDHDLLYFQGQLLDRSSGERRCFVSVPFGVQTLVPRPVSNSRWNLRSHSTYAWRRTINGNGVSLRGGQPLFQWETQTWAASRSVPVAAILQSRNSSELRGFNPHSTTQFEVDMRDIVLGETIHTDQLPVSFSNDTSGRNYFGETFLATAGRVIVAVIRDELFVCPISEKSISRLTQPLELVYPQLDIVDTNGPLSIQLQAQGGTPPYQFRLTQKSDGLRIDAELGAVSIELPRILSEYVNQIKIGARADVASLIRLYARGPRFEQLAGTSVSDSQVVVALPLSFEVVDQSGQHDSIDVSLVSMAPRSRIESALEAATQLNQAALRPRKQPRNAEVGEQSDPSLQLEARIKELEIRIRQLEAAAARDPKSQSEDRPNR